MNFTNFISTEVARRVSTLQTFNFLPFWHIFLFGKNFVLYHSIKIRDMKDKHSKHKEKQGITNDNIENSNVENEHLEKNEPEITAEMPTIEEKLAEANDKYLRLSAEFDNYRKRTAREKLDILRNGGEEIMKGLLPVLDDFDRCVQSLETATDMVALKEGVLLIQSKLLGFLKSQGLSEIEAINGDLDTSLHDAITKFPVSEENKKGKIIDIAQKGYMLNDKVIRFAKVIVGE